MSEIKALDKLCKLARNRQQNWEKVIFAQDEYKQILEIADEIEAEIVYRFMMLPLDADGMPIHVGDELECNGNGYEGTFMVFGVGDKSVIGNHEIGWVKDHPSEWFHIASWCKHIKPKMLEDVLFDMLHQKENSYCTDEALVEKYVEVIQNFMSDRR